MEFQYRYRKSDYVAIYELELRPLKARRRSQYYYGIYWYLGGLALGAHVALKHDELFIAIVFAVLAVNYLQGTWSYERAWKADAESYANLNPESLVTLTLDDVGYTELLGSIRTQVGWTEFNDYLMEGDRVLLRYLKNRWLVVPLETLSQEQRNELVAFLECKGLPKRAIEATTS